MFFFDKESFNECKNELIAAFHQNWEKSCLPTIAKKFIKTKDIADKYRKFNH